MSIGSRIQAARESATDSKGKKLSRAALSEICDVTERTIYKWEKGITQPSLEKLELVAKATGVSVEYLRTGSEEQEATHRGYTKEELLKGLEIAYFDGDLSKDEIWDLLARIRDEEKKRGLG